MPAVMGPSGSGKSTLLNCISCYIPFEEGTITLGGQELKGLSEEALARVRNEKLGFVFQDFMLLDGLTVRENILVPRIIQGKVDKEAEKLSDSFLSLFGIEHIKNKYPADISGGERQRTAVARSLNLLCNFVSLLLITAYSAMMFSPTVLLVLPEGGDSRKQMVAIFVLALLGVLILSSTSSLLGIAAGFPFVFLLWNGFRLFIVDNTQMTLRLDFKCLINLFYTPVFALPTMTFSSTRWVTISSATRTTMLSQKRLLPIGRKQLHSSI